MIKALTVLVSLLTLSHLLVGGELNGPDTYSMDLHQYEKIGNNESEFTDEISSTLKKFFELQYAEQETRRGVHPKSHGCYSATMKINPHLSKEDQVGIFQAGKSYEAFLRFSNGGPRPSNIDSAADTRGIGIKVLNVGRPQLLPISDSDSQDFTLNSSDTFFADSVQDYSRFMNFALLENETFSDAAIEYILDTVKMWEPAKAFRIYQAFDRIQSVIATNPLAIDYFSITPFQHGAGTRSEVVKYKVTPCSGNWIEEVNSENPNFLRENLNKHLSSKPGCFSFQVQKIPKLKLNGKSHDPSDLTKFVEESTRAWTTELSEFREFAKILIPSQSALDATSCDRSVINPWNTIAEHKPIGGINRMRLSAYLFSIEMRMRQHRTQR